MERQRQGRDPDAIIPKWRRTLPPSAPKPTLRRSISLSRLSLSLSLSSGVPRRIQRVIEFLSFGVCCQDGVAGFTGGSGEGNQEVKSEMASEPRDNEDDEDEDAFAAA